MPPAQIQRRPNLPLLAALASFSILVVVAGATRNYSFIPDRALDGFADQLKYIEDAIQRGQWTDLLSSPLKFVHVLRYVVTWPFLMAEAYLGPVGSLSLLMVLLGPLITGFRPQRGDWRDVAFVAIRFLALLLPLFVSGRTVLVIAGMGYLVSGVLLSPFSLARILIGALLAVLSSASILFSIAILVLGSGGRARSRVFQTAKWVLVALVVAIFVPSLLAKAEGFMSGSAGYSFEDEERGRIESHKRYEDDFGIGPMPAVQRILARSTVAESYRDGNIVRLGIYLALFALALAYVMGSLLTGNRHPMVAVLGILSLGIFLEGLALWPIVFPLLWAYTGVVREKQPGKSVV